MGKMRLDQLVVMRGLATSGEQARRYILAGLVRVDGLQKPKPGQQVDTNIAIEVSKPEKYVSRGAYKLLHAIEHFPVALHGRCAVDFGSSTGGFVQVLLECGALPVIAVDVGTSQLHQSLREDPRVVVLEKTNARYLELESFGGHRPSIVTADLSFISLTKVMDSIARILGDGGEVFALIKPQFESQRKDVSRGRGVIKDPLLWRQAMEAVVVSAASHGITAIGLVPSPILGGSGNREFLFYGIRRREVGQVGERETRLIEAALASLEPTEGG
jgi:23S rRNA (cytidine1920-2'-O)/16S rRNA (cytidine1409-2'-O)-methyltransferase